MDIDTIARTTITLPVSLAGRTEQVAFTCWGTSADKGHSDLIFTGHIGRGAKTHRVSITAWRFGTEAEAKAKGYRGALLHEVDGAWWGVQMIGYALNRQVHISGWVADAAATSAHIMEYR